MSVAEIVGRLALAYPSAEVRNETLVLYARSLADVPPGLLERAVDAVIRTEKWFPALATVREQCAELALSLPIEPVALAQVDARIRWARDRTVDPPFVDALVLDAVNLVGGFHAFRVADDPSVIRGQFARIFRELRAQAIRDAQISRELPAGSRGRELDA